MSKFIARLLVIVTVISALLLLSSCNSDVHIGENGNWWVGDEDTGVSAVGPKGDKGETGDAGADGIDGIDGKNGKPGADGIDGVAGKDAVTPIFRYNLDSDRVEVSYDSGNSWLEFPVYPADTSLMGEYSYPISTIEPLDGTIENMGNKFMLNKDYYGAIIPLAEFSEYDTVTIVPSANTAEFGFAFLSEDLVVDRAAKYAEGYYEVVWPEGSDPVTVSIPKDAKHLYVYYASNGTIYLPSAVTFSKSGASK